MLASLLVPNRVGMAVCGNWPSRTGIWIRPPPPTTASTMPAKKAAGARSVQSMIMGVRIRKKSPVRGHRANKGFRYSRENPNPEETNGSGSLGEGFVGHRQGVVGLGQFVRHRVDGALPLGDDRGGDGVAQYVCDGAAHIEEVVDAELQQQAGFRQAEHGQHGSD